MATRITDSADSQAMSTYFIRDVQSALCLTTDSSASATCKTTPGTTPHVCPSGAAGTSTLLVALEESPSGTTVGATVSYWEVQSTGPRVKYSLVRSYCTATAYTTPQSVLHLALDPSSGAYQATIKCTSVQPPPTTTQPACQTPTNAPTSSWITTGGIEGVALSPVESGSKYQYMLEATPRTWSSPFGGYQSGFTLYPPLTLLGMGGTTCVLCLKGSHNAVVVTGIGTNTHSTHAITLNGSNNQLTGPTSRTPTYFQVYKCATPCHVVRVANSSDIAPQDATTWPTKFRKPTVPQPDTTGLPAATPQKTGKLYHLPPGAYSEPVNISASTTRIVFTGHDATYFFHTRVTIEGATITFGTGNKIVLGNGLSISANSTLIGQGALFYVAGGKVAITSHASATIHPASTSTYKDILLFQASPDTTTVTITGGNSATLYGGEIEAPTASVKLGGRTSPMRVGSVIAKTLILHGTSNFFHINVV